VGSAYACGIEPPVEFALDETPVFEQPHDLFPHYLIQQILAHRTVG
jgi:hypothetical protein